MRLRHTIRAVVLSATVLLTVLCATGRAAGAFTITTTAPLPSDSVGQGYSDTLHAVNGTGALHWSVAFASLPPGLTLNATTGVISGTPTTAGQFDFGITASDSSAPTAKTAKAFLALMITPQVVPAVYVTQGGHVP